MKLLLIFTIGLLAVAVVHAQDTVTLPEEKTEQPADPPGHRQRTISPELLENEARQRVVEAVALENDTQHYQRKKSDTSFITNVAGWRSVGCDTVREFQLLPTFGDPSCGKWHFCDHCGRLPLPGYEEWERESIIIVQDKSRLDSTTYYFHNILLIQSDGVICADPDGENILVGILPDSIRRYDYRFESDSSASGYYSWTLELSDNFGVVQAQFHQDYEGILSAVCTPGGIPLKKAARESESVQEPAIMRRRLAPESLE